MKQSEAVNGTTDNAGPPNKFVREGYRSGINQDSVGNKAAISGTKGKTQEHPAYVDLMGN